jgi:hypothetical protein
MPTLESYIENAEKLAQDVINVWGLIASSGHEKDLKPEFDALVGKSQMFRTMKEVADNHRTFGILTPETEEKAVAARRDFAEAYKAFEERNHSFEQSAQ